MARRGTRDTRRRFRQAGDEEPRPQQAAAWARPVPAPGAVLLAMGLVVLPGRLTLASHLCLLHQAPIALPSGTCAKRQKVRVRTDTQTRSAGAGHPDGARPRESRASRCLSLRREPKDTRGVFNGNTKSNKLPLAHSFFFLKQA